MRRFRLKSDVAIERFVTVYGAWNFCAFQIRIFLFDTWTWIIITNSDLNTYQCLYLCLPFRKTLNRSKKRFESTSFPKSSFAVNPQAPVAQKVADELVFRRFQGEGVAFFLIGPHWPPPLKFLMHIFWKIPILALPACNFQWVFISRSCFESDGFIAYSNEWDLREKTIFIHTSLPLIT